MMWVPPKFRGWHKWFAWYPVFIWRTADNKSGYVWFMTIERNWMPTGTLAPEYGWWDYR